MYKKISDVITLQEDFEHKPLFQGNFIDRPRKLLSQNVIEKMSSSDPKVWGPPFWFTLHTSAVYYPLDPSPIVRERLKNRILAIPYEIPCAVCRPHAVAYIEKNKDRLDTIVSSRDELGKFYVDFHNQVNIRYNKPVWTYEQALKHYSGN